MLAGVNAAINAAGSTASHKDYSIKSGMKRKNYCTVPIMYVSRNANGSKCIYGDSGIGTTGLQQQNRGITFALNNRVTTVPYHTLAPVRHANMWFLFIGRTGESRRIN